MRVETLQVRSRGRTPSWGGVVALAAVAPWFLTVGCSAWDASGDRGAEEAIEVRRSNLTNAEIARVLGMEDPALWRSTTATLSSSTNRVQGQASLGVRATNFNFIDSIPLTRFTLTDNTVRFSILLPSPQANPFWYGDVQMVVNAPSVGLFSQYVGNVGLTGKPLNQFTTINMTLPPNIVQALAGQFNDLVIRLVLNVPSNATGTYLIDNLVFGGVSADNLPPGPPVTMTVEPTESGNIVYLPLAPKQNGGSSVGQFTLDVRFQNTGTVDATVSNLIVSFAGGPAVPPRTYPVNITMSPGGSGRFPFTRDTTILLPQPAPTSVTVQAQIAGFTTPVTIARPLVAHVAPVAGGAWSFPADALDIAPQFFWRSRSTQHNPGNDQGFALDMGVVHPNREGTAWTELKTGTDGSQNTDYLIWGVPVRAMADGTVLSFSDDHPTNPTVGTTYQNTVCAPSNNTAPGCPVPDEGNAFFIQSGPEMMLYAHFQPGTLPAELKVVGAPVRKGQILGLAGNSGNSSNPHLHIHAARGTVPNNGSLRPIPFQNVWMIDETLNTPRNPNAPWVFVTNKGVPEVSSLIFASPNRPNL